MFRKITLMFTAVLVLIGAMALTSCSSDPNAVPVADKKPVSHVGAWQAEGFDATVTSAGITINIVSDDETDALYWEGSFEDRNGAVTSTANTAALDSSMLGSQDDSKVFTVTDDVITFKITIAGVSKVIHLKPKG